MKSGEDSLDVEATLSFSFVVILYMGLELFIMNGSFNNIILTTLNFKWRWNCQFIKFYPSLCPSILDRKTEITFP